MQLYATAANQRIVQQNNKTVMKKTFFLLAALLSVAAMAVATDIKEGVTTAINGVESIKCSSNVTLHISKGKQATVRVVENAKVHSTVSFVEKTLTVEIENDKHGNRNIDNNMAKTELFVTLPQMTDISNSGILKLDANDMTASGNVKISNDGQAIITFSSLSSASGGLSVSNGGVVTLSLGTIDVADFTIDNNGVTKTLKNTAIRAKNAKISNSGMLAANGMTVNADRCSLSCSGIANGSTLNINSDETEIKVSGSYSTETAVKGKSLAVLVSGSLGGKMNFDGGNMSLNCSGITSSSINVKCDALSLSASGIIKGTVSGNTRSATFSGNITDKCTKGLTAGIVYLNGDDAVTGGSSEMW